MSNYRRYVLAPVFLLLLIPLLAGCYDPNLAVREYAMIVSEGDISQLEMFPNLEVADLRGSTCYDTILEYSVAHPDVTVRYNVFLGDVKVDSTETDLAVNSRSIPYEDLLTNLKYLPKLKKLELSDTEFTLEQIESLRASYPKITFDYTIRLFGTEYPSSATEVNFAKLSRDSIADAAQKLKMLPNVTYVELMSPIGFSDLSVSDVKTLQSAMPDIQFHYTFDLFGKLVSTTDETIVFNEYKLSNKSEAEIRSALDILKACKVFTLDDCGIDSAILDAINQDYPNVDIVWRLHFGRYSVLTNEQTIRMPSGVTNQKADDLKYCTEVVNLDLSFNRTLSNFEFIRSMPKLKNVVLNETVITDLTVFENCPDLQWLELVFCYRLANLAPLTANPNLKYLNVSFSSVKDLSVLRSVPLERFICVKGRTSNADEQSFISEHPNCITRFTGGAQALGWRYDSDSKEYTEPYKELVEIFRYNEKGYVGNVK